MPRVGESIGQDPKDRSYYVVIDGVRVASYPFLRSALAHIEAHRDREGNTITFTLDCSPPRRAGRSSRKARSRSRRSISS